MRVSALLRGTVDLMLTVIFAGLAVTGIGLYMAPKGRIAHLTGWTFLGMSRESLATLHTYLGFVMIGLVALHIALGFRGMIAMLRAGIGHKRRKKSAPQ